MNATPLADGVQDYLDKGYARFHMPGHKGRGISAFSAILPYDITEVAGADSLYEPDGILLALEQAFARTYGSQRSLLSAGGATLCIQTMLALACGKGTKLIASRNIHRSAINTMALLDLQPVWIYPDTSAGEWYLGRYTPQSVEQAILANPDAKAVYITSPDYFGVVSDLAGIAEVCNRYRIPLLVDNAHGAHFRLLPSAYCIQHPMECGAAMCADSLHKTLPAMTGGAVLHINHSAFVQDAKRMMSMFGSSSPSYPILLSCEQALSYAHTEGIAGFADTGERFDRLRLTAQEQGFALPEGVCDPAKLILGFGALGTSREAFGAHLRCFGIEPEYVSTTACVLMGNGMNPPEDFARIQRALEQITPQGRMESPSMELPRPEQEISVREASFAQQVHLPVENCVGRIAAGECSPCPPGIPVVMGGERLDGNTVKLLKNYGILECLVVE